MCVWWYAHTVVIVDNLQCRQRHTAAEGERDVRVHEEACIGHGLRSWQHMLWTVHERTRQRCQVNQTHSYIPKSPMVSSTMMIFACITLAGIITVN